MSTLLRPQWSDHQRFTHHNIVSPGTLFESIEQFCDPKFLPTTIDYVNLVVRYVTAYFLGNASTKVTEEIANHVLTIISRPKLQTTQQQTMIQQLEYPLRMLLDIGSTVDIVRDITERDIAFTDHYTGVDMGTGSGIMLLAQYIQARRNGYKNKDITNIGIEIDDFSAKKTAEIMEQLRVAEVRKGDSSKLDTYKKIQKVSFITNENIPFPRMPFSRMQDSTYAEEPFFYNIMAMRDAQVDIENTQIFPQYLEIASIRFTKNTSGDYIIEENADINQPRKIINGCCENIDIARLSPGFFQCFTAPTKISIQDTMIALEKVGMRYYSDIYHEDRKEESPLVDNIFANGRWNSTFMPKIP